MKTEELENVVKISRVYYHAQQCCKCYKMVERSKVKPDGWRWCCLDCLNNKSAQNVKDI